MRNILSVCAIASLFLVGCIKNDPVVFNGALAEFDAASYNANSLGVVYPIIPRVPVFGRVAGTTDSTLRRYAQTVRLRINLIGPQSAKAETVGYETFASPLIAPADSLVFPATITGQTPAAASAKLKVFTAVSGSDYSALSGTVTIPANSSFGYLDVPLLAKSATPGTARFIGLRLNNNGSIKPSVNYSEVGLLIDQR